MNCRPLDSSHLIPGKENRKVVDEVGERNEVHEHTGGALLGDPGPRPNLVGGPDGYWEKSWNPGRPDRSH
jgi:hypothetical protein